MAKPPDSERSQRVVLADLIQRHQGDIESRWLAAVRADLGHRSLDLTELRDAMPDYLKALARELRSKGDTGTLEMRGSAAWTPVAQEHAVTRVRQGFDIEELVHEFIVLRRVLFDVARENGVAADFRTSGRLADVIEAGLATSVRSYVESRDYAARRVQAEHIGFMTHELKAPLTAALVVAERLETSLRLEGAQRDQFELLVRNLGRLRNLVEGVLLMEKFGADEMKVEATMMPLADLLEGPVNSARAVADAKGLVLDVNCPTELTVLADPKLTESVIGNLLDNAVKYTDEGVVTVSCKQSGEGVEFHVRDNCPGLSPEELRTIFEPFHRGHRHDKPGAGLGLAIAKRAVDAQGGSIGAESPADRGCHFWFSLPSRH
jgi:signal transduction histidine kinase